MFPGKTQSARIVFKDCVDGAPTVIQALLDSVGMFMYCRKIVPYVLFAHHKTKISYVLEVAMFKIPFPVKGNAATLDDEMLSVL